MKDWYLKKSYHKSKIVIVMILNSRLHRIGEKKLLLEKKGQLNPNLGFSDDLFLCFFFVFWDLFWLTRARRKQTMHCTVRVRLERLEFQEFLHRRKKIPKNELVRSNFPEAILKMFTLNYPIILFIFKECFHYGMIYDNLFCTMPLE